MSDPVIECYNGVTTFQSQGSIWPKHPDAKPLEEGFEEQARSFRQLWDDRFCSAALAGTCLLPASSQEPLQHLMVTSKPEGCSWGICTSDLSSAFILLPKQWETHMVTDLKQLAGIFVWLLTNTKQIQDLRLYWPTAVPGKIQEQKKAYREDLCYKNKIRSA